VIRFSRVTKDYPRTGVAIANVSFRLGRGEFAFLTGPSGSGKSTILKLSYLDEFPTQGDVWVTGQNTREVKPRDVSMLRRKLGIVFQDFRLLENRTAEQNVAFALEVTGAARAAIGPKVARVLTQVGLASKGTAYPKELSGGEQQRVAIARALANRPEVLFADEPTGELDRRTGEEIIALFDRLNHDGTTMVIVTHDAKVAHSARRVVEMADGLVVSGGR